MFVFWNPCARAKLHQQKRALKLCSATLIHNDGARRKNRWLAKKSVVLEHDQALSADNLREPVSKMSEHFVKGSIEKQGLFWIFAQMELLPVVENED